MQTLESILRIDEAEQKNILLEVMSDKYCRIILGTTMFKPKSAMEITAETKIPISTVYRRIQTLYDNKLLRTSGTITDEGKRLFLYKSKVRGIHSRFEDGQTEVEIILNK